MRVTLGTVDVPIAMRRYIRRLYGQKGLATRQEVRQWYISTADSEWEAGVIDEDFTSDV